MTIIVLLGLLCPRTVYANAPILLTLMNAAQAVVQIESENAQMVRRNGSPSNSIITAAKYIRTGTGILIDSDGIIATNAHVVIQAARIRVYLPNGNVFDAKPLLVDRPHDLCLLKIEAQTQLPSLPLADISKVTLNSKIYSIGGSNLLRNTLSEGKVTGIAFTKSSKKNAMKKQVKDIRLFQINLDLYQGDSGSPIFNTQGEVIGIISAAAQRKGKTAFTVPASIIKGHLEELSRRAQIEPSSVRRRRTASYSPGQPLAATSPAQG